MLKIIPATARHHAAPVSWLSSYFLFSFADYYDPQNTQFGPLRVFNDDTIQAQSGFPQHPHSDMEIVTLVLDGELTHEDTSGNKRVIRKGDVQRMTAGTGIAHSEFNRTDKPVHLYQLWFLPSQKGLAFSYEDMEMNFLDSPKNELRPLVSGQKVLENVVYMNSNSTVYWCDLREDKTVIFKTFPIRNTFIYVTEGSLYINGVDIGPNDQVRSTDEHVLEIRASKNAQFILIDLPAAEVNF